MPLLWLLTALSAVVTATLGWMHAKEGIEGASIGAHRALGISLAVGTLAAWALRRWGSRAFGYLRVPVVIVLLVLVTLTGHYGGNITHGSGYLVQYAPIPNCKFTPGQLLGANTSCLQSSNRGSLASARLLGSCSSRADILRQFPNQPDISPGLNDLQAGQLTRWMYEALRADLSTALACAGAHAVVMLYV